MNVLGIDPGRFLVARDVNGEIVGFGQIEINRRYAEVRSMYVKEPFR